MRDYKNTHAYFVGGGIASLAGACYLIRDCSFPGDHIHIFEELNVLGGSNDGAGNPETGYIIRGGRMLNDETYENTWELLLSIPSIDNPEKSVREEIIEFDSQHPTHSNARLVNNNGEVVDVSSMDFDNEDRIALAKLIVTPEEKLNMLKISDWFKPHFFETNFWYMWATTFAFQPWHSLAELRRYMIRFMHEFPRIHTLEGVTRTPYNQYDSLILPIKKFLENHNVDFKLKCVVTDLDFKDSDKITVTRIYYKEEGMEKTIELNESDVVFVTNGSMTEGYSLGSMTKPPVLNDKGASWKLWDKISKKKQGLGNPTVFDDNIQGSKWESFTVTCHNSKFFDLMEKFSHNKAGTGALVTFKDSNWFMSIVLAHQPHFRNQPDNVKVFWGYGLYPDNPGNYVKKKMSECTGEEILIELLHHLKFEKEMDDIIKSANCIPCMMPFITAQFMPRSIGDRPQVVPEGSTNLAFIGQFCEIPDDVVFTEEYSVRSARIAVYKLFGITRPVEPINQYQYDIRTLFKSFVTMFK